MKDKIYNLVIKASNTIKELLLLYIGIILIAASLYSLFEGKDFGTALWWAAVTAMTVGYGDAYPVTTGGKVVAIILMHIVPLALIPLITAHLSSKLIVNNDAWTDQEQEEVKGNLRMLVAWMNEEKAKKGGNNGI